MALCPLDCPDACTLAVEVRDERVHSVDGSADNPVTDGYICAKVRRLPEHVHGDARILRPAVRAGAKGSGEFRPVSWDEALDRVAEALATARRRHGGESILPFSYGGSNGLLTQDTTDARLFWRLGASRLARTVCAAPTGAAARGMYGKMAGVAYPDYPLAELIAIWGCNPAVTGIHLMPYLQEARRRGARLVVVDPRATALARRADLHLAVRPGSDVAVALSVVRWLFETGHADEAFLERHATGVDELRRRAAEWSFAAAAEVAGVDAADIERLARWYAAADPALIRCGWGVERNRNGGSAVAAILALPAVGGKFGVRGGGYTMSNSAVWKLRSAAAARAEPPDTRVVNMNRLGRALTGYDDPPVNVLFVYNANPLATVPRQALVRRGLAREDLFTVVFDAVLTDTARYADVLLPATTFLEHEELSRGYGNYVLQRAAPEMSPVGESRPNYDVFAELCERCGVARPGDPRGADALAAAILEEDGDGVGAHAAHAVNLKERGISFPDFAAGRDRGSQGSAPTPPVASEAAPGPVQFVDVFPETEDGRIRLVPEELDAEAPEGLYAYREDPAPQEFPLALISPASKRTISSTLGQLRREQVPVEIDAADAAARGIEDGDRVRVFNEFGEVRCRARLSGEMRPGLVYLPKGLWSHNTLDGNTGTALVPDSLTDIAGGACFNDARVEVERLG